MDASAASHLSEEKERKKWDTTESMPLKEIKPGGLETVKSHRARKAVPASEQGYVLLIALFFLALFTLSLAVAVPQITKSIQRDRDLETFHRGMQYRRAIQLYYRKFHAYPPSLDALVNTNDIRFLRKKYIDPTTGKDDWKPILFGQNKTPTAMGFFGQPLTGSASSIAGIGPSGGNGLPGSSTNGNDSFFGGSSFGSDSSDNSASGSSGAGSDQTSSGTSGSSNNSSNSTSSSDNSSGSSDNSGSASGSTPASSGSTSSSGSSSTGLGSSTGQGNPTFGGAGVIGFEPASPKQSILVYKKKDHYNQWEFTYDPLSEMVARHGGGAGLNDQNSTNSNNPSSGFGSTSSSSSSPTDQNTNQNLNPTPMPPDTSAPQ